MNEGEKALMKIESHEELCSVRYQGIKDSVEGIERRFTRMEKTLLTVAGTVMLQLVSAVAWFLVHGAK